MLKTFLKALKLPIKIGSDEFGNKYYEKINKEGKFNSTLIYNMLTLIITCSNMLTLMINRKGF